MDNKSFHSSKCICVPSGICHPIDMAGNGCPHEHYYDKNNKWRCSFKKQQQTILTPYIAPYNNSSK
jgi:hypothetical protein